MSNSVYPDDVTSRADAVLAALKAGASLAASSVETARRLAASGADQSTSSAQLLAALESIGSMIESASVLAQDLSRGQHTIGDSIRSIQQGVDSSATSAARISAVWLELRF